MTQGAQTQRSVTTHRVGRWEAGGRLKGTGTHVHPWLILADVWQKPTRHCKAMILKLKVSKFKLKKNFFKKSNLATQGDEAGMFYRLHSEFRVTRVFPVGQSRLTGRKTCLHSQFIWPWKWVTSSFLHFSLVPPFRVSSHSLQSHQRGPHENRGQDFPGGPVVNSPPSRAGDTGSIPGLGRFRTLWGH